MKCTIVLQYLTLRDRSFGDTSNTATIAVTTRRVPLLIGKNILHFFHK
jgi:hypothetical protein